MARVSFVGRLVQGSVHKPGKQRVNKDTKQPKFRADGTPDAPFYAAIAIAKNPQQRFIVAGGPSYEEQKAICDQAARTAWPQHFGTRPAGLHVPNPSLPADCKSPKFANKIMDGDGFDEEGNPNSAKEGWAGCWVVKFSNGFAPKCWRWDEGIDNWKELGPHDPVKIKCGDYVGVSADCVSNTSDQSPGMYMNFDTVTLEKEGEEIQQSEGVDPSAALGRRGPNAQAGGAGAASSGGGVAGTTNSATASPAYSGYRETAPAPGPDDDGPAPPDDGPTMTAAAQYTYEQYIAAGWTDAKLRAKGLMV